MAILPDHCKDVSLRQVDFPLTEEQHRVIRPRA